MVDVPKICETCIHNQVCNKKDNFNSAVQYFKNWEISSFAQDVIATVRCAHYCDIPKEVLFRNIHLDPYENYPPEE